MSGLRGLLRRTALGRCYSERPVGSASSRSGSGGPGTPSSQAASARMALGMDVVSPTASGGSPHAGVLSSRQSASASLIVTTGGAGSSMALLQPSARLG
mmetsp:Transcript_22920/g.50273  ORF Transcript_22920/g.50273 Transcript_22920/m.50273 type:complete len:99 (+) Transcript_22920:836-1132(+)